MLALDVRDGVDVRQGAEVDRGTLGHAGRAVAVHLVGLDHALVVGAGDLDRAGGRGPHASDGYFLSPVEHQFDRCPGAARQFHGGDALRTGVKLAAKTAAHVVGDAFDASGRELEAWAQLPGDFRNCLRRGPHGQVLLILVPLGDQAVRLQALVTDHRHAVVRFHDRGGVLVGLGVKVLGDVFAAGLDVGSSGAANGANGVP